MFDNFDPKKLITKKKEILDKIKNKNEIIKNTIKVFFDVSFEPFLYQCFKHISY